MKRTARMKESVLFYTVLSLVGCFLLLYGIMDHYRRKAKTLQSQLKEKDKNIAVLLDHAKDIAGIENDKEAVTYELRKAKTPEEISAIIDGLINANNSRVQNNSKY